MRRNKFRAIKTTVDGIVFMSKAEAARYCELMQMQDEDAIYMLECQVPYQLFGEGRKGSKYIADFRYWKRDKHGSGPDIWTVEDVKGHVNQIAKMKILMMKELLGIDVQIIKMNSADVNTILAGYAGQAKRDSKQINCAESRNR